MSRRVRRIAALAACSAAVGVMAVAPGGAAAECAPVPFDHRAVYGSLTPKKLNEPVILPKGSTFNGYAEVTSASFTEITGVIRGHLFVPPFKAMLKLAGLVPSTVGVKLTEVGEAEGTIEQVPATGACLSPKALGACVRLSVTSKANIGLTMVGLLGIEVPTECETTEPVVFPLSTVTTQLGNGVHFAGTVTIPPIKCEGVSGIVLGALVTTLMSGPENPYKLGLFSHEPGAPVATTEAPSRVSQISALLHAQVNENGEPLTACHFEYGTSTSYGTSLPCTAKPGDNFDAQASGLGEGTTYHYRVVATNSLGTSNGADQQFSTLSAAAAPQYGHCVAQKQSGYRDSACEEAAKPMKGKFEWKPGPAPTCIAVKKGEYTDSSCATKSAKPHKGGFEKQAGPGYSSVIGPTTLDMPGLGKGALVCEGGTATGQITGARTASAQLMLTGCKVAGKKCASEGPSATPSGTAGSVTTNLLASTLLGPVSARVWIELASAQHQPYLAEFACEGLAFRVKGSVSGVRTGDVGATSTTSTSSFAPQEGLQVLSSELSEDGGKSWGAANPATATMVLTNTAELSTEIKR
jgi:hypothetical protein